MLCFRVISDDIDPNNKGEYTSCNKWHATSDDEDDALYWTTVRDYVRLWKRLRWLMMPTNYPME